MINTEKITISIWDREFELPVTFEHFSDETVTKEQEKALKKFTSHKKWIVKSKETTEAYCKEMVSQDDKNEKKDNIFSYLKPERIFVTRSEPHPEVAIMCKYRYDLEHGLAVVFSNNGDTRVVIQDEIL